MAELLWLGLALGLGEALAVGPLFLTIVHEAAARGFRAGGRVVLGATVVDAALLPPALLFAGALGAAGGLAPWLALPGIAGFLYLAATAGFEVTPSTKVDEAWHLHLEWPHYSEILCGRLIGRTLEHRPGTGEPEDEARCLRQYEETLVLYERVFGRKPPTDIWPRPAAEEEDEDEGDRPTGDRARKISRSLSLLSLAGAALALPFGGLGSAFPLLCFALMFFILGQPAIGLSSSRKAGGNCGGGCGGGGSGSSDGGGCAGCGGGCGGD